MLEFADLAIKVAGIELFGRLFGVAVWLGSFDEHIMSEAKMSLVIVLSGIALLTDTAVVVGIIDIRLQCVGRFSRLSNGMHGKQMISEIRF